MDEELVAVGGFLDPSEVHLAKHRLEDAGIRCTLDNEQMGGMLGAAVGVKLVVRRSDLPRAQEILTGMQPKPDGPSAPANDPAPDPAGEWTPAEELAHRAWKLSLVASVPHVSWLLWRAAAATPKGEPYPRYFQRTLVLNIIQWCVLVLLVTVLIWAVVRT